MQKKDRVVFKFLRMPKDRRVSSSSFDRSMVHPYSCSSKVSDCKNSKRSLPHVGDEKEWEEVRCPICMEHPHNAVLLLCSSHEKGCRPFLCDTSYRHSNCFDQFRKSSAAANLHSLLGEQQSEFLCPFCRGTITGLDVRHPARVFMNSKTRSCALETCSFSGNYAELRKHARLVHPSKRPSEASPIRQTNWTMLEQQREIEDALLFQSDIDVWPSFDELDQLVDDDFWSEGSFFDFPSGMSDVGDDVIEEMLSGLSTSCFSLYSFSYDDDVMDSGNSRLRDQPQRATITGPRFNAHLGNATPSYHSEDDADASRSIADYQRERYSLNVRSRSGYDRGNGETISSSRSSYQRADDAASSRPRSSYSREPGQNSSRSGSRYYREVAPESSRRRSSYRREDEQPNSRLGSVFYGRDLAPTPVITYATRVYPDSSRQTRSDPGRGGV